MTHVRALADFQGAEAGELSFKEGEVLVLLEKDDSGWAKGILRDRKGWFPWDYVEVVPEPPKPEPKAAPVAERHKSGDVVSPRKRTIVLKPVIVEDKAASMSAVPAAATASAAAILAPPAPASPSVARPTPSFVKAAPAPVEEPVPSPRVMQPTEVLKSPRTGDGSRKVAVTVVKKEAPPAPTGSDGVLDIFFNDAPKVELYATVLAGPGNAEKKFHQSALELYESYLDEISRALRLVHNRERQNLSAPTSPADPFNPGNLRRLLQVFRHFVVSVGSRERMGFGLCEAVDIVLHLARQLKVPVTTASKDERKNLLPSAKGEPEQPPDTVLEFLTGSVLELLRVREADLAAVLPEAKRNELAQFLYHCLFFVNPPACRRQAAEALGFLSAVSLDAVVTLFTKELSVCKEWKEYVTHQRAVPVACAFALDQTLVKYLTLLHQFESKDSTLFITIAQSMIDILVKTQAATAIPTIENDELRHAIVSILYRFYESVGKQWYKKPKTKLHSFKLQLFLYALFDIQKMDLCKKDVTKLLLDMLRDAKHRRETIEEYSSFLRSLPLEFARGPSGKVWRAISSEALGALFVRKARDVEVKELTSVLTELLRLDMSILHSDVLIAVIKSNDYSMEARGVVLRCVGTAVVMCPDKTVGETLQPTVTPVLLRDIVTPSMFEQVCICFPHLVIVEKRRALASLLIPSALSSNPELWTPSLQALQRHMLTEGPHMGHLLSEVFAYLGQQACPSDDDMLAYARALCLLLSTFLNSRSNTTLGGSSSEAWSVLEAQLEAFAFAWALNGNAEVRAEACQLFNLIGRVTVLLRNGPLTPADWSSLINTDVLEASAVRRTKKEWQLQLCEVVLSAPDARRAESLLCGAWAVLCRPIRLDDYCWFLARTLHVALKGPGNAQALATDVISHFLTAVANDSTAVRVQACDALERLDDAALESVVRISATTDKNSKQRKAATLRVKNKAELTDTGQAFVTLLRFHHLVAQKTPPALFRASQVVRAFVRERVAFWAAQPTDSFTVLAGEARVQLTGLIGASITLESYAEDTVVALDAAEFNDKLMSLVADFAVPLLGGSSEDSLTTSIAPAAAVGGGTTQLQQLQLQQQQPGDTDDELAAAVAQALVCFLRDSPLLGKRLLTMWAPLVFRFAAEWPSQAPALVVALSHVVARFPTKLQRVARDSVAADGNVMWFQALALALERDAAEWLRKVQPEELVYITLLHLCSTDTAARDAAVSVVNVLARHAVAPAYEGVSSPNLLHLHVEQALDYSRALSEARPAFTSMLLTCSAALFPHLDTLDKATVLQLLAPWLKNFATLDPSAAVTFLDALFAVTQACNLVSHSQHVQSAWKNVFGKPEARVSTVVDFLVAHYASAPEETVLALSSLLRTEQGPRVVEYTVSRLQTYGVVAEPSLLLAGRNMDESEEQQAVFLLLVYVSHERASLLWPFLASVLHAAFVRADEDPAMLGPCQELVANVLGSVRTSAGPAAAVDVVGLLSRGEGILLIVEAFSTISPTLRGDWATQCLRWCAWSASEAIALRCLSLWRALHRGQLSVETAKKVSLLVLAVLYRGAFRLLDALLVALGELAAEHGCESDAVNTQLASVALSLLASARHQQVALALALLRKLPSLPKALGDVARTALAGAEDDWSAYKSALTRPLLLDSLREPHLWLLRTMVSHTAETAAPAQRYAVQVLLVSSALQALASDSGREAAHAYFASESTPLALRAQLNELFSRKGFHLKPASRHQFVADWCDALLLLLPRPAAGECFDVLVILLRYSDSLRALAYELLVGLMEAMPYRLTAAQWKHVAEMATLHCFTLNEEVRSWAQRILLDLVGQYQDAVVPAQNLALVRVVPATSALEADRLEALFVGDTPHDFAHLLKLSTEALYVSRLGGSRGDSVCKTLEDRFRDQLAFPGVTDNTAAQLSRRSLRPAASHKNSLGRNAPAPARKDDTDGRKSLRDRGKGVVKRQLRSVFGSEAASSSTVAAAAAPSSSTSSHPTALNGGGELVSDTEVVLAKRK